MRIWGSQRQDDVQQGNYGRYLLYAFGEVLLVVLGILIAFQIDNWNDNRVQLKQEITILQQLNLDLTQTRQEIESISSNMRSIMSSRDSVLILLAEPGSQAEDFVRHIPRIQFTSGFFNVPQTTYKFIESEGMRFISNYELRTQITQIYEEDFHNITERRALEWDLAKNQLYPLLLKHVDPTITEYADYELLGLPADVNKMKSDRQFRAILVKLNEINEGRLGALAETLDTIDELLLAVDAEIESLGR